MMQNLSSPVGNIKLNDNAVLQRYWNGMGEELHRSIRGGVKGVHENLINQL